MRVIITLLALIILPTITRSGDFVSGSASCPSSGAVQVSTTKYDLFSLTVTATITNTGYIHLGGPSVTTSNGGVLTPGASYSVTRNGNSVSPSTLYFACTVSADTITWIGAR